MDPPNWKTQRRRPRLRTAPDRSAGQAGDRGPSGLGRAPGGRAVRLWQSTPAGPSLCVVAGGSDARPTHRAAGTAPSHWRVRPAGASMTSEGRATHGGVIEEDCPPQQPASTVSRAAQPAPPAAATDDRQAPCRVPPARGSLRRVRRQPGQPDAGGNISTDPEPADPRDTFAAPRAVHVQRHDVAHHHSDPDGQPIAQSDATARADSEPGSRLPRAADPRRRGRRHPVVDRQAVRDERGGPPCRQPADHRPPPHPGRGRDLPLAYRPRDACAVLDRRSRSAPGWSRPGHQGQRLRPGARHELVASRRATPAPTSGATG